MARRTRSDSVSGQIGMFQAAQKKHRFNWPELAPKLTDTGQQAIAEGIFQVYVAKRHPDDWCGASLLQAAELSRLDVMATTLTQRIFDDGAVFVTEEGTKSHPITPTLNGMNSRRAKLVGGLGLQPADETKRTMASRADSFQKAGKVLRRASESDSLLAGGDLLGMDQFA